MDNILIVGIGIIGGSLVRRLYEHNIIVSVLDVNNSELELCYKECESKEFTNFNEYDHIILCVSINHIKDYLIKLSECGFNAQVYDCGSTKEEISLLASNLNLNYIGLHPMCGSERSGFINSTSSLFESKTLIATQSNNFVNTLNVLLDSNLVILDSNIHDKLVSQISHVPQLLSLLIDDVEDEARSISGQGFKDMTRISNSSYSMWEDILKTNNSNICNDLKKLSTKLNVLIDNLDNENYDDIKLLFKR